MNTPKDAPARAGSKPLTESQAASIQQDQQGTLRQVDGDAVVRGGNAPGTVLAPEVKNSLIIDGLGDLSEVSDFDVPKEDPNEGSGPYLVVLSDFMTGANGVPFYKGDVRRASKLINGYGNEDTIGQARFEAKRLFDIGAIRQAMSFEEGKGRIEINTNAETSDLTTVRNQLLESERQNEILRAQLAEAQKAQQAASPKTPTDPSGMPQL